MDAQIQWWVWLLAGLATGIVPILGAPNILGIVQALIVLASPVVIYMNAGTAFLPYVLFYGGLMVTVSFLHKRKTAADSAQLKASVDAKKKRWG